MSDISMCKNKKCKFKEECHRFTAKPDEFWQSYSDFNCEDKSGPDTFFLNNGHDVWLIKNKVTLKE